MERAIGPVARLEVMPGTRTVRTAHWQQWLPDAPETEMAVSPPLHARAVPRGRCIGPRRDDLPRGTILSSEGEHPGCMIRAVTWSNSGNSMFGDMPVVRIASDPLCLCQNRAGSGSPRNRGLRRRAIPRSGSGQCDQRGCRHDRGDDMQQDERDLDAGRGVERKRLDE